MSLATTCLEVDIAGVIVCVTTEPGDGGFGPESAVAEAIRASRAAIVQIVEEILRAGAAAAEVAAPAVPLPREVLPPRRLATVPGTASEPAVERAPEAEVVRGLDMGQRVAKP